MNLSNNSKKRRRNDCNNKVWNIDNQLVIADTIEEAIAIRKEYDKDYYDHNIINEVKLITVTNCVTEVNFAIKKEEK